ncbi:MAG: S9 family peptidase [Deltaproteobacteria bacterium]|nr:S9 family peptidase [Deltaproteobacteria bacterium]
MNPLAHALLLVCLAQVPSTVSAPAPSVPAKGYSGLGSASVPRELIERYAPRPFDPELTRQVQAMMDVRAPGMGLTSPAGDRLYFTWTVTGTRQVWRLDGPERFPQQLTGGEDATWVVDVTPDGRQLILQRDRKGEENPGLYLQDAKGGALVVVQHKPGVQTHHQLVTPDGAWLYYSSNDQRPDSYALYRYGLRTGARETVLAEPGLWSVEDRLADGTLLLRKDTGALWAQYWELAPGAAKPAPLFGQDEKAEYQARYLGPGRLVVLTNKLGEFRRLYTWSAGALQPLTAAEPRWDVSDFGIDQARTRILYTTNEGGYTRLAGLDARTLRPLDLPKLPAADHAFFGATTRDGRFTTLGVETSISPRTSFVYDWKKKALTRWVIPSAPEIDTSRFAVPALESYPARDGTKIPMFVRRPAGCPGGPCPVVVEFHGGPEGQSVAGFNTRAQLFVDAGFVYVLPNVRGSNGYGRSWLEADDGARRLAVITDIEDCARHLRSSEARDGKAPRLGAFGGSYGGYAVLMAMSYFAGAFDAGASVVGISNLLSFLENTAPYRRILRTSEYGDPDKDREMLVKLSPVTYVDRIAAPLLLIQGVSDPRVPVGEAIQMRDAIVGRGLPVELILFPDEGHGTQKRDNSVQTLGQALQFFEKHLKGAAQSAGR